MHRTTLNLLLDACMLTYMHTYVQAFIYFHEETGTYLGTYIITYNNRHTDHICIHTDTRCMCIHIHTYACMHTYILMSVESYVQISSFF